MTIHITAALDILQNMDAPGNDIPDVTWAAMQGSLTALFGDNAARKLFLRHYYGLETSTDAPQWVRRAVRAWLNVAKTEAGWAVSSVAWQSAPELIRLAQEAERRKLLDAGQMELL